MAKSRPRRNLVSKNLNRSPNSDEFELFSKPRESYRAMFNFGFIEVRGNLQRLDSNNDNVSGTQVWHGDIDPISVE